MKYKTIKKNSSVETYQDNLFLAVTDMFTEKYKLFLLLQMFRCLK